jgi:hypothetical protein
MKLTTDQWATAVRPLLDHGIIKVPGWTNKVHRPVWQTDTTDWRRYDSDCMACYRMIDKATDLDRLAFLAVIEDSLRAAGCDGSLGAGLCTWIGHSLRFAVAAHDRETAALSAAYHQWPELGEWPI